MADDLEKEMKSLSEKMAKLEPKQLYRVMRGPVKKEMRRVARKVANQAIKSGLNVDLEEFKKRSVRGRANNDLSGGFVTVKAGNQYMGKQGQYLTRHGSRYRGGYARYKPIAMWAAEGTVMRETRTGKSTGRMKPYRFISNGDTLLMPVEDRLYKDLEKRVDKIMQQ